MTAAVFEAWVEDLYASGWCQRVRKGMRSWRHISEGGFNQRDYRVHRIDHQSAHRFVMTHHYSASYSQVRRRYGLIHDRTDQLVGVATLGCGMHPNMLTNPLPTLDATTAAELARLVLLDEVPANAESWFTTQAFGDAYDDGLRGVVALSDPLPRPEIGMPGHVGTIYQAMNAAYCGRATASPLTVLPDGTVLTKRTLQKVSGSESGAGGVIRRLVAAGARPYGQPLAGSAWLRAALADVGAQRRPHPGNHRFVFRLGKTKRERERIPLGLPTGDYPKYPDDLWELAA